MDETVNQRSESLTGPTWTDCAKTREFCDFSGTRQVRFGRDGRWTVRTFTDGVSCTRSTFGATGSYRRGNVCQVDTSSDTSSTPPAAEEDAGMPMETDAGSTSTGGDTSSGGGTSTGGGMDTGGSTGMMMGPSIDRSAIPTGDPGVGEVQIRPTTDKPVPSDIGAFRTSCLFSHMNFDDPIVYPGQPGKSHLHAFFGNTGTDASSTAESLRNSGNSTCRGGIANRTAYWVPAVIDANGKPVKPVGANIYYKTGYAGIRPDEVTQFPQGLRMIAGNAKADSDANNEGGMWGCEENYIGHPHAIPQCQQGDHVLMIVQFPQCWDGKNLDSPDHKSHMAYPQDGRCPSTHPVPIPEIMYNIRYAVPAGGTAGWRLASDMYDTSKPGGYSAHGDWFEGWDPAISKAFITNCDNKSVDCHSHLLGDGREIYNSRETD